jgi:quinol monooxygenase YgiN
MASDIEFVVEWTVTGDPARFRELAHAAAEMVRTEEPRARRYQWYVNPAGTTYLLTECYADSAAMLLHMEHIARLLPELEKVGRVTRFEILGDLTPEAETAAAATGAKRFRYVEGVNR